MLPADDSAWDEGDVVTSEPVFVTSATNVKAGHFARTCQAAHLVGRVVFHVNESSVDSRFRFSEAAQLHRTMAPLATLLTAEFETEPDSLSTSLALCYSAMMKLYDPYSCNNNFPGENVAEETGMQVIAISGLQTTAEEILHFGQRLKSTMSFDSPGISPLIADSFYQAASTFAWMAEERRAPEVTVPYGQMVEVLRLLDSRWKVAGEYLNILQTSDFSIAAQACPTAVPNYPP